MSWHAQWTALAARIRGLLQAGNFLAQALQFNSGEAYRGSLELIEEAGRIFAEIERFASLNSSVLPDDAKTALDRFLNNNRDMFTDRRSKRSMRHEMFKARLPILAALEGEVSFHLVGKQEQIFRRSERAFIHLQRCIAADPTTHDTWQNAFNTRETACEKLGGAHLLLHGIWAFKVDAAGGRTDLVFPGPLEDMAPVERAAEGLVLTEWKLARSGNEVGGKFEEAREQGERYAGGVLAGIELTSYRYAVVVTEGRVTPPDDQTTGNARWRHINIAVNPEVPSRG